MDKMNGNNTETNEMNDNSTNNQSNDLVDSQMNLSFGKKRFFGKKADSTAEPHQKSIDSQVNTTKRSQNKWPTISSSNSSNQLSNNSNGFKFSATDLQNEDKFLGEGIQFSAKLIGHEFVAEARGEQMCQQSLKKLKILHKGLGGHKRKVHLFISFDGIKIRDATTSELIYHHSVPQISFISRDESDTRAFGYVFGSSSTGHQFISFKTQKEAMPIMSAIGQLFAATLMRKKSEINYNESVTTVVTAPVTPVTTGAINEEKIRRESSATLRPSRSESPNVPSMPAPPVPTKSSSSSAPAVEELDFFSAFEPMDSVFESDFKMPITGTDPLSADPFASSFGSLSLSSGDWANFDEDNSLSASGGSHQQSNSHPFAQNSIKPFDISIPMNRNDFQQKPQQLANSFNDSSSSMALNNLFNASGHHNQIKSSAQLSANIVNSEAVAIPQRNVNRNNSQSAQNQSVGSTTSSADRYACFAEIHSISSSIFDSMCDQMAAEAELQLSKQQYQTSKSLNSSLNGGFGIECQQQLSSSLNKPGDNFYYSFDNPLNSELQKQNFLFANNYQNSGLSSQQNTNEFNAQNVWNNNNFNNNSDFNPNNNNNNSFNPNINQSNNVWSTSSSLSDRSLANSQFSGASSPPPPSITAPTPPNPMTTLGFGMNRSNDMLNDINPVFAELDPLGNNRPFVNRAQFFAEQKQKPTLKDLNSDHPPNNRSMSANSVPYSNQINDTFNQTLSNVSVIQSRPLSSNANPFVDSDSSSNNSRLSPNPFNPFNTTSAVNPRPPALTTPPLVPTLPEKSYTPPPPLPPPRPPSRECPPVPPRNDLNREGPKTPTPEAAPPLPRRRTILPEHRYQSFDAIHRQNVDPFSPDPQLNTYNNSFSKNDSSNYMRIMSEDITPAPPLPNPQRKVPTNSLPAVPPPQPMARKLSSSSSLFSGKTNQTSSSWDPFNCSFVDLQLSSISAENTTQSFLNSNSFETNPDISDIQLNSNNTSTSTPKQTSEIVPNKRQFSEDWKLSEIKSRYDLIPESVDKSSESSLETPVAEQAFGFSSDFSQFSEQKLLKHNLDLSLSSDNSSEIFGLKSVAKQNVLNNSSSVDSPPDSREDHISPPERNIFIPKADPFADDFFAQ